jgi:DNA-directed RNA polymerase subunit RPC12/RpoP
VERYVENNEEDIEYLCPNCGAIVKRSEIELLPSLMCPRCGFRGLFKLKRPGKILFRAV